MNLKRRVIAVIVLMFAVPTAFADGGSDRPKPVALNDVRVQGELGQRLEASFNRLEEEWYVPPKLYDEPNDGWPGDKEGRTLLGLILLSQVTGREAKHLQDSIDMYPKRVNARGYLGPVPAADTISEQTLGGQFWMLRALNEYAAWKKDERVRAWAEQLLNNVYLSAAGAFREYPIDLSARKSQDFVFGKETGRSGKWILSSDVGCGLAGTLDCLTDTYARKPSKDIESVVEEVIERFVKMDLEEIGAQLHSTLVSTRSLLRYYETTGRKVLLEAAIERYRLYRDRAMTDNFENYNWFRRPQWTEGCAVVDSFITAVQLWRFTGDPQYLEDAHHIYYNGMCVGQRSNGGVGCDSCPSRENPFLSIKTQEAYWCCTQRAAEGLSKAAQYGFFTDETGVFVPFYHDGEAVLRWKEHTIKLRVKTEYPWEGNVQIEVVSIEGSAPVSLRLFVPSWAEKPSVAINGQSEKFTPSQGFISIERPWRSGDKVELSFTQRVMAKPPVNRVNGAEQGDYHTYHYGPLMLGYDGAETLKLSRDAKIERKGHRQFMVGDNGIILRPIYHLLDPAVSQSRGYRMQILFQD